MKTFPILGISFAVAMLIASSVIPQVLGQSIVLSAIKTEIYPRDDVFVTGFVDINSFYKTVTLTVYDPSGNMIYKPNVTYDDQGRFTWLFHPPIPQFETGVYTIVTSHENISETVEIQFEVIPIPTEQPSNPLNIESQQKVEVQENPTNEIHRK